MVIVAHNSTSDEIGSLKDVFQEWNTSNSGELSYEEFTTAISDFVLDKRQLPLIFDEVNIGGSGNIRYTEFLAATIEMHGPILEDQLAEAFDLLDSDDSGYISSACLKDLLGAGISTEDIDLVILEATQWKGRTMSYSQFLSLWTQPQTSVHQVDGIKLKATREKKLSALS